MRGAAEPFEAPVSPGIADELYRSAVEACPAAMILVGANGVVEHANTECCRMFGYEHDELVGMLVDALVPPNQRAPHDAHRRNFMAQPTKRRMGEGRHLRAIRKDGSLFPVEIGLTPVAAAQERVWAFVIDITERRRSEELVHRRTHELELANESLAQFAYVASHDIQEPLRKIVAFSDLLADAVGINDRSEILMASEVMHLAALRARKVVQNVMALSQSVNGAYDVRTASIISLVDESLQMLSQFIQESEAVISTDIEDVTVKADRTQGIRLIENLISNAIKYRKPNCPPKISIYSKRSDDGGIVLAVEDSGIGFDPAHREEIFRPFKRLWSQDEYPGSGIGLAICNAIASRLGWSISAFSEPEVGSRFEILFPASGA
jgi:PAS domain S-box-containing protein